MDELLHDRVQQLREIDERLERIERLPTFDPTGQLRSLRLDLARMIAVAEAEYEAF